MVSYTVYFTGMMVFTLTSQMYHRISVLVPVLVRVLVHEYECKYEYYDFRTHEYKYITSTRISVLKYCEYEYPSPAQHQSWLWTHKLYIYIYITLWLNTLRPEQNWLLFFKMTSLNAFSGLRSFVFWSKFHCNLFPQVILKIRHHLVQIMLGDKQVTNHYLKQCWPSSRMPFDIMPYIYNSSHMTQIILSKPGKHHDCWNSGSLHYQVINNHSTGNERYASSWLSWGRISTNCAISVRRKKKCKYIFLSWKFSSWNVLTHMPLKKKSQWHHMH